MNEIAEKAAARAEALAADNTHGYDQQHRWGPDYDCSSLVITAYRLAGAALTCTYTGNMRPDMLSRGFRDVTGAVDLATGAGLEPGDVLLNEKSHTAIYIGNGMLVQASGNERGGVTGGRTGDQTGTEIARGRYYNFPWDCVLRYGEDAPAAKNGPDTYTVRAGDSLWSIAERTMGSGFLYPRLQQLNGLTGTALRPGQVLRLRETAEEKPAAERCALTLPRLAPGSTGAAVEALQALLCLRGETLPRWGTDGDFGAETAAALRSFAGTDMADGPVWEKLVG